MEKKVCKSKLKKILQTRIFKFSLVPDAKYSELMLSEGAATPVDDDMNFVMELPDWADENLIKK